MNLKWEAKWIWDNSGPHPRNYYVCFRKNINIDEYVTRADLAICADSRYVLYVNGHHIGRGPVRSWPFRQSYDTYDIANLLHRGKNVIAVLVMHFGVSNFQYIEGRGGLLAQARLVEGGKERLIKTDSSWKTHAHIGYRRNSMRINCQQGWAEVYDAGNAVDRWQFPEFDDSSWEDAIQIGEYGMAPWTGLQPRDIPMPREDEVYPKRIEKISKVLPIGKNISFDIHPNFFPGEQDSNPRIFSGFISSIIMSPKKMNGKLRFPWDNWLSVYGDFSINGRNYCIEGQREVEIELDEGDNFFLMDISGHYHGLFVYLNWELEQEIEFKAPLYPDHEFITIGPFDKNAIINAGEVRDNTIPWDNPCYLKLKNLKDVDDLIDFKSWIHPVSKEHSTSDNVYMSMVYKEVINEENVLDRDQNMIIPNDEYTIIKSPEMGDLEFILDFGQEVSGYIEFEMDAPEGVVVDFYGVEYISPDASPQHTEGVNCTLRYITCNGRQKYRSIVRRGFRYLFITLRNVREAVKIYRICTLMDTYPVVQSGYFESSDWELNKIWEISRHTTKMCMEDTFVDCPTYEQTYWVGDARNQSLINYYVFGAYPISKRSLYLVADSLKRSRFPESQVPSGWQSVLTAWALFWMSACFEYYEYTGDMDFLRKLYPDLIKASEAFMACVNDKDLLELQAWNMLDWAPMETPDRGIVTHQNAELVKALRNVSSIAELLGDTKKSNQLKQRAMDIKKAINLHLWSEEDQAYIDCIYDNGKKSKNISMQTNVMVYLCDCVEGERREKLEGYLVNPPSGFVRIGSPFMYFFYFEALMKIKDISGMLNEIRDRWSGMLKEGATTCWETFPGFHEKYLTRSHCHGWSAAPGYFLGAYILGIRPLKAGFEKVLIDPVPCDLKWARGSVPTPKGRIDIWWENHDGILRVKIHGPKEIKYISQEGIEMVFI